MRQPSPAPRVMRQPGSVMPVPQARTVWFAVSSFGTPAWSKAL
ncbi:hypothetical protein ACU4GG_00645 [Streptomyces nojiriensis]